MMRKTILYTLLVFFCMISTGIVTEKSSSAEESVLIDITFTTGENGLLFANGVIVAPELNFSSTDILSLVDTLMNDPINLRKDLTANQYNVLIDISGTLRR